MRFRIKVITKKLLCTKYTLMIEDLTGKCIFCKYLDLKCIKKNKNIKF